MKANVSVRALSQRMERKGVRVHDLRDLKLCGTRPKSKARQLYGRWYLVDTVRNEVAVTHVDIEDLGRKIGALKPWEELAK